MENNTKEILFHEYYFNWINANKKDTVRRSTFEKYINAHKNVKKYAPGLTIGDLNHTNYQELISKYGEDHEKQTVRDFHRYLRASIIDLVDDGLLQKDPTKKLFITGKEPSTTKKDKFLSQFEVQCLIRSLDLGNEINTDYFIFLLIKTGMRFAECAALTPSDFDLDRQSLNVSKTWDYKFLTGFIPTKTANSVRKIQLDWQTMRKFIPLLQDIPPNEPLFLYNRRAKNLCPGTVGDELERKCKECGIPVINVHGLRHTHASLLLAAGVSVASVSKRLGHASIDVTQRVYLHLIRELENRDNGLVLAAMMNLDV